MKLINNNYDEDSAVKRLAELIALEHGVSPGVAKRIRIAASLHDIGKRSIPDEILNKPGKLTERERDIMKTHTVLGAEMLKSIQGELGEMARACCRWHHEWYNGGGYWGRRTEELPFYLPYISISDVFTALVSERVYKAAWPPAEAMSYIQSMAGTQFSPELTAIFLRLIQNDSRVAAIFNTL